MGSYKEGSSLFRCHISVANIVQSSGSVLNTIIYVREGWTYVMGVNCGVSTSILMQVALSHSETVSGSRHLQ